MYVRSSGLDVLRMVVRCLPGNQLMCARGAEFLERLIQLLTVDNSAANMLSLRVLANLFAHSVGTTLLCCNVDQVKRRSLALWTVTVRTLFLGSDFGPP